MAMRLVGALLGRTQELPRRHEDDRVESFAAGSLGTAKRVAVPVAGLADDDRQIGVAELRAGPRRGA